MDYIFKFNKYYIFKKIIVKDFIYPAMYNGVLSVFLMYSLKILIAKLLQRKSKIVFGYELFFLQLNIKE